MKKSYLIALGASVALNAFLVLKPQTVEVYTNSDIYYLNGDTLSSEVEGVIFVGEGASDTLTNLTARDCSPGSLFGSLAHYGGQGYLSIVKFHDGDMELQYSGPNFGPDPKNKISLVLEGFTDVYTDSVKTTYYMQVD